MKNDRQHSGYFLVFGAGLDNNVKRGGLGVGERERQVSGGIRKRRTHDGRLRFQAYINVPDPRRPGCRYQVARTFGDRPEAADWLDREKVRLREQPSRSRRTAKDPAQRFFQYWIDEVAPHQVRVSTLRSYRQMMAHIIRHLGAIPLERIDPLDVQDLFGTLLKEGKRPGVISSPVVFLSPHRGAPRRGARCAMARY